MKPKSSAAATCPACEFPVHGIQARCRKCGGMLHASQDAAELGHSDELPPLAADRPAIPPRDDGDVAENANTPAATSQAADVLLITCRCGRRLRAKVEWAGRSLKCPKCRGRVAVPASSPGDQEPAASGASQGFAGIAAQIESKLADATAGQKRSLAPWRLARLKKAVRAARSAKITTEARKEALVQLGASRDPRALPLLLEKLEDPLPEVRQTAVAALGDLGGPGVAAPLVRMLDDPFAPVRRAAVTSLGKTETRLAVRPLLLVGGRDPSMKFLAAESIAQLGAEAIPELLALLSSQNCEVAEDAVAVLARLKEPRTAKAIAAVIESSRSPSLRAAGAEALGQIHEPRAAGALRKLLHDPDPRVRRAAAGALVKMPDPANLEPLIVVLADSDSDVVLHAAAALGELGEREAAPALLRLLDSRDASLRLAALESLTKLEDRRAVKPLLELAHSADEKIQLRALAALKRAKDRRAVPAMLQFLDDANPVVRQRAIDVLGALGDAEVAELLESILRNDRSEEVRAAAARALGEIADPVSVGVLLEALRDEFTVRCRAILALGAIRDPAALGGLLAMLKDLTPEVRFHAAGALGQIGSEKAIASLTGLLAEENSPMVRRGVLKALEQLGAPQNEDALRWTDRLRSAKDWCFSLTAALPPSARPRATVAATAAVFTVGAAVMLLGLPGGSANETGPLVPRGKVASVSFSPDGSLLAVGRTSGLVEIWDPVGKQLVTQDFLQARQAAFAADSRTVGLMSGNGIKFWNTTTDGPQAVTDQVGHAKAAVTLLISPGRKFAATIGFDKTLVVWDLARKEHTGAVEIPIKDFELTALSPDGALVAAANPSGEIALWDSQTAARVRGLRGPTSRVLALAFDTQGERLAAAYPEQVIIWNVQQGAPQARLAVEIAPERLLFRPGAEELIGVAGRQVAILDLSSGSVRPLDGVQPAAINGLSVSADGKWLALGGEQNTEVWIYDLESGKAVGELDAN